MHHLIIHGLIHGILEALTGLKAGNLSRRNLNLSAGLGITPSPSRPIPNGEGTKSHQRDLIPILQRLRNRFDERIECPSRVRFGDVCICRYFFNQLRFIHFRPPLDVGLLINDGCGGVGICCACQTTRKTVLL